MNLHFKYLQHYNNTSLLHIDSTQKVLGKILVHGNVNHMSCIALLEVFTLNTALNSVAMNRLRPNVWPSGGASSYFGTVSPFLI